MHSPIAKTAARNLRRIVSEDVPEEMRDWSPALAFVRRRSDAFLDALLRLDAEDTSENREAVRQAAEDLRSAWLHARQVWEIAGRPGDPSKGVLA